jgi:UDP-glucose 4-epimerase
MVPLLEGADIVVHLGEEKERKIYAERSSITLEKVAKWRKNVEGFRRLLEASIICGVKRVILSSWAGVYVASAGNRFSENEPLVPINQYYHQKISQEYYNKMFASEYLLDTATLRISNVFGVGPEPERWRVDGDPGVIAAMTESALRQGEIVVHNKGLQKRNFIYVGDVVDALVSMILSKRNFSGGSFNICADEEVKIIDIANWIAEMCDARICHKDMNWQKNIVQHSVSNVKARKVLGFSPRGDVRDRLQEMVKTVRASGCFR